MSELKMFDFVMIVMIWELILFLSLVIMNACLRGLCEILSRAPGLDLMTALIVVLPWVAGIIFKNWLGLGLSVLGQALALTVFAVSHTFYHQLRFKNQGSRIRKTLSHVVGPIRFICGVSSTALAIPCFLVLRVGQLTVYPLLGFFLKFPPYKQGEWIRISRQKFEGLVGLDLMACLYCEWAAGVYALGGEMVRNNESFWCPIRFYNQKHCENCKIDFPDLKEWIPIDGSMAEVESLLKKKYPKDTKGFNSWYGHSDRKD
ncbi:MAG: hypothetical protein COV44_09050 [Deltaproteobacteria bacterium CG11_big_fil_rev_8_21_14_0_20_45_16]|nr:MAG: hypothetical protein COV44_09050 [Deltaproteobacteria bacterium CG11_big_fil_rev_8_21_14_0_20_45_16]